MKQSNGKQKHNRLLLKKVLRKQFTDEELIKLSETLPDGFGKQMCIRAANRPVIKPKPQEEDTDQTAADDYLDYLESRW